ncbi:MAG: FtsX-like permease family protein [Bacteroides sp.]|nr:FtsX-like permease family protein [Bacteroides sp.]
MKRNLFKQMRNEWRDNVWLIIELMVVCLAIWIIMVLLFVRTEGLFTPRGYNPDNVYSLSANTVPKESTDYIELESDDDYFADLKTLIGRIKDNPNVEDVTIHWNGLPYNYDHSGNRLFLFEERDTIGYYGNRRTVTPDYIKVMGITSKTGATTDQLVEMLRQGEILISDDNQEYPGDPYKLKGKKVIFGNDSSTVMRVGDIIQKVRRNDYELSWGASIIYPLNENRAWGGLAIRVKPGTGKAFAEDFKKDINLRRLRNTYLADLEALSDIREGNQRSIETDLRLYYVMIGFLLMTVFLGLLGTFWFRLQQRVSEIAIRKVVGAKKSQVFRRILSEGLLLLCIAVIIVSAIMWSLILTDFEMINIGLEWYKILALEAVTVILVAVGIIISLWWPAKKAMAIEPAIAIKDE